MSSIDESLSSIATRHEDGMEGVIGNIVGTSATKETAQDEGTDVDQLISKILGGEKV